MRRMTVSRFCFLFATIWMLMLLCGCTTAWVGEAQSIIGLLVPAVAAAVGVLASTGVNVPADVLAIVQDWSHQATAALGTVATLINQYQTAEASAQPGILVEIKTGLDTIVTNLQTILPQLHITNPNTQSQVNLIFQAVEDEMTALINLVPAIQGKVTSHKELKKLHAALLSADEFQAKMNGLLAPFNKSIAA